MPVDPLLAPLLDIYNSMPPPTWTDAADRRRVDTEQDPSALYAQFIAPLPEVASVWEEKIPVAQPPGSITVRVYRAATTAATAPALVEIHGGGWWSGGFADVDGRCRALAVDAGVVVVSVDYRLSPEFPYPTPLSDVHAALHWTIDNAGRLGIDPDRIGIAGVSAGANLAAALALLVRDRGEPPLRLQLLEIPVLDLTLSAPSTRTYAEGFVLTSDDLRWCVQQYLGDRDRTEPLASPLHAEDLSGLPPAVIAVAECDPLADDGACYADRLREAGVATSYHCYPGLVHSAHILTGLLPTARAWQEDVVAAVRNGLTS
jgi:acetyl esterase